MGGSPIVFLDTETTGVHPEREVWEIGMIRRDSDGSEQPLQLFLEVDLAKADLRGLEIGGFYERHPMGRYLAGLDPSFPEPAYEWNGEPIGEYVIRQVAAAQVARVTHKAHIVAAVPSFDTEVLATLLRDHLLVPAWHYHIIDAETLMIGYLAGRNVEASRHAPIAEMAAFRIPDLPWDSEQLSRMVGVEPPPAEWRHTAMGDADWARRAWDMTLGQATAFHTQITDAQESSDHVDGRMITG